MAAEKYIICKKAEIHNRKRHTRTVSSIIFAIMVVLLHFFARTEVKSLAVFMNIYCRLFYGAVIQPKTTIHRRHENTQYFRQTLSVLGNLYSVKVRKVYLKFHEYIFTVLVVRADIDFITLKKVEMTSHKSVVTLIQIMKGYPLEGSFL